MKVIGRLKEIAIFNQIFASKQAEFVAVYGRKAEQTIVFSDDYSSWTKTQSLGRRINKWNN